MHKGLIYQRPMLPLYCSLMACYAARYQKALDPSGLTDTEGVVTERSEVSMKRRPTNNRNFRRAAKRVRPVNHYTPMRGGIRL